MAARNKPAGIRSLVYGMGKGKAGIEGLSVSKRKQCPKPGLFGRSLTVANRKGLIAPHGLVADRRDHEKPGT